jgi:hypothetical protein
LEEEEKMKMCVRSPTVTNFKKLIKWMNYLYAKHVVCEQRARDEKQRERGEHCSGLLSFIFLVR